MYLISTESNARHSCKYSTCIISFTHPAKRQGGHSYYISPPPLYFFRRGTWGTDMLTFTTSQGHREGAPRFKPAVRLRSLQTSPPCYSVPFVRTPFCQAESQAASCPICGKTETTLWPAEQVRMEALVPPAHGSGPGSGSGTGPVS